MDTDMLKQVHTMLSVVIVSCTCCGDESFMLRAANTNAKLRRTAKTRTVHPPPSSFNCVSNAGKKQKSVVSVLKDNYDRLKGGTLHI